MSNKTTRTACIIFAITITLVAIVTSIQRVTFSAYAVLRLLSGDRSVSITGASLSYLGRTIVLSPDRVEGLNRAFQEARLEDHGLLMTEAEKGTLCGTELTMRLSVNGVDVHALTTFVITDGLAVVIDSEPFLSAFSNEDPDYWFVPWQLSSEEEQLLNIDPCFATCCSKY